MRLPTLMRALLSASVLLVVAFVSPCTAATGSWSPRSSQIAGHVWTRAGWIRVDHAHTEIAPTTPVRHHSVPPYATAKTSYGLNHFVSDQRPERHTPSRDRGQLASTVLARLRTSALPDRRARSAALAARAGIFHEAHAPPSFS